MCEWLHGFEPANANGYNHFEEDLEASVLPSGFILGFELARLTGDDLESLCDQRAEDIDGLRDTALRAITADLRDCLRLGLSSFFGGDDPLCLALNSAIWPELRKVMTEAMDQLLPASDYEDLAALDAPWRSVSEGRCDEAEN